MPVRSKLQQAVVRLTSTLLKLRSDQLIAEGVLAGLIQFSSDGGALVKKTISDLDGISGEKIGYQEFSGSMAVGSFLERVGEMGELSIHQEEGGERRLTAAEFQHLAAVPAAVEWFANIDNPRTRRAYQNDLADFSSFIGLASADDFRVVNRAHVLAWRAQLEKRGLAGATIRRKLAALASLFDHLLECNAVAGGNPVHGVKRPRIETNEGKTPALGDHQAKALLDAPDVATLKGLRDRAVLAVLLYHGLRREEAAQLTVGDILERRGIKHLLIHGKGGKVRYLPLHPVAADRLHDYLERSGHHLVAPKGPLFLPLRGPGDRGGITADGIYKLVETYAKKAGIKVDGLGVHGLRATAATNALEHEADIAKVQAWLGHANISTTRIYDRRQNRPEDSPTYRVKY